MSVHLSQLWLPILLGGLLTWIASAVIHMVLKYHNRDYRQLPNEDAVAEALRAGGAGAGFYNLPYCVDMAQMNSEEMQTKFRQGPVGLVALLPTGMPPMGKLIGQQIVFCLLACLMIAYVAALALPVGADYMTVFRLVAAVGFLTFGWANIPQSIWLGQPWGNTARYLLDALIYGLLAAGVFAWLWPA